jgi:hypothetical protein
MQQHDWQRMDVDDLGRARELWTPLAEAACETLLGEVIPAWVRVCARDLARLQGGLRACGDHHVATLLRNVPPRMRGVFARMEENVRQILKAALGAAVQGGAEDSTVYYTANGWLVCLDDTVLEGERRQMDARFFRVAAPIAEFLRGAERCKPPAMTTGQVAARAAQFRAGVELPSTLWSPVVPFRDPGAVGAFLWFVFDLPAGGTVAPLAGGMQLYQARLDGMYAEAVFALRDDMQGKCASFPLAFRPGAVRALLPIAQRVCDGEGVFRLLMNLSRRGSDALFRVDCGAGRLREVLPALTVALADLLRPSRETYTSEVGGDVCVARAGRTELTVIAADDGFRIV